MKGKILKTLSAMAITTAMVAALMLPSVAGVTYGEGVSGNKVSYKKILITDTDTECPEASFNYTVSAPANAIPAAGTNAAVLPGPNPSSVIVAPVSYTAGTTADTTSAVSGKKTYTKDIEVDLTGVKFTEPGIFRYYVQETIPDASAFYYDVAADALTTNGDCYRTLDVYVEDASTATSPALVVTGYVLYDGQITAAPGATTEAKDTNSAITSAVSIGTNGVATATGTTLAESGSAGTKTDNIMNYYKSYDLTISKEVTGNQGSRDEYFLFTVVINAPAGSKFAVSADSNMDSVVAANTINGEHTNSSEILTVAEGATSVSREFWLQNGQNVTITGIGENTTYSVTEGFDTNSPLGYTVSAKVNGNDQALTDNGFSGTITADTLAAFTNAKNGVIPTGVLLTATPVIVVGVLVVAGIAFFAVKSAKRKAAEAAEAESED